MNADHAVSEAPKRRGPVSRPVILLTVTTVALAVFIVAIGDTRRRSMAVDEARWYAGVLTTRLGEMRALPLNLEIEVPPELKAKLSRFEWLTREQAHRLRARSGRFIVAQTEEVRQVLRTKGRAVVFFENGQFSCEWLSRARFDELYALQQDRLNEDRQGPPEDAPG